MRSTIRAIRIFFFCLCVAGSYLTAMVVPEWDAHRWLALFIGAALGALVILTDILLKGFSLRGLSALSFGLFTGWMAAFFITKSPIFEYPFDSDGGDNLILTQNLFLARMATFVVLMYLGSVIALRGKDEFNLVIPYVRFVPHGVDVPLAVVDASALIDGRILGIAECKFLGHALIVPQFVIDGLHHMADHRDPPRRARGRRGLETLRGLQGLGHLDLRIDQSTVDDQRSIDAKIVFLAQSLKAKVLTTDFNLAQIADVHHVEWLNITNLARALNPETSSGDSFDLELVKRGKERDQAVGYLPDGSMVVVENAAWRIGETVAVKVQSVLPSAAGKLVFAQLEEAT
jgi:uncharacterized protein YacL